MYIDFRLVLILLFDEKVGMFEIICFLVLSWVDEKIRWDFFVVNIIFMYLNLLFLWLFEMFF